VPRRIESLDGLRGVAALIVLVHHALLLIPALAAPYYLPGAAGDSGSWAWLMVHTPIHLLWDGIGPVYIFFVLSGLVLALPVLRAQRFDWRTYYPQRLIRLYLPIWGAVALAIATILAVPRNGDMNNEWLAHHIELSWKAIIQDLTLLRGAGQVASPLWSLEWEVLFSLLLPLYVWLALKLPKLNLVKVALLICMTGIGAAIGLKILHYLPMFMIGVIMAVEWKRMERMAFRISGARRANYVWALVTVVAVLLMSFPWILMLTPASEAALDASKGLVLVGAALVVFLAWHWVPAKQVLCWKPVQWLGTISFSLYLVHEPLVIATAYLLGSDMVLAAVPVGIVASLVVASVFFRLVERPSHLLAKTVHRRLAVRGSQPAAQDAELAIPLTGRRKA